MRHIDPADLAERALDEDAALLAPWEVRHLRWCPACLDQLEAFRRVVRASRSMTADDVPVPPPRRVWNSLIHEVTVGAQERKLPRTGESTDEPGRPAPRWRAGRLGSSRPWAAAMAVLCLVLGGSAGSTITWWEMRQPSESVATGGGEPLTSPQTGDARGEVRLIQEGEARRVRVTVHGLPSSAGYYEVWLMDRTHRKLIPLGTLGSGGSSTLTLPKDVNTDIYVLLDISAQSYDGSTAHSGNSVVRGPLPGDAPGGAAGA